MQSFAERTRLPIFLFPLLSHKDFPSLLKSILSTSKKIFPTLKISSLHSKMFCFLPQKYFLSSLFFPISSPLSQGFPLLAQKYFVYSPKNISHSQDFLSLLKKMFPAPKIFPLLSPYPYFISSRTKISLPCSKVFCPFPKKSPPSQKDFLSLFVFSTSQKIFPLLSP